MTATMKSHPQREAQHVPRDLTGAQILWQTLLDQGTDVVFGYPW
jgi:hypothetical protein